MAFVHPLYLHHPEGQPVDLERLKQAKALSWVDFPLKPHEATPGVGRRVLAVGGRPNWLCDYVLITNQTPLEEVAEALEWATGIAEDLTATTVADTLSALAGRNVREIPPEELEAEAKLRAYQQGL